MSKIKIITGWSAEGGSTFSLMELCDLFNERGHECYMYGPHAWHLDKCEGARPMTDLKIEKDDIGLAPSHLSKCQSCGPYI